LDFRTSLSNCFKTLSEEQVVVCISKKAFTIFSKSVAVIAVVVEDDDDDDEDGDEDDDEKEVSNDGDGDDKVNESVENEEVAEGKIGEEMGSEIGVESKKSNKTRGLILEQCKRKSEGGLPAMVDN
jgi:hypothetical protein